MSDRLTVVPFPQPTSTTETLVKTLEALLERARDGDIENFIFVGIARDGGAVAARSCEPGSPIYALIGATENRLRVLHRLLEHKGESQTVFSPNGDGA